MRSRYTRQCNFMCTHTKSTNLHPPIFKKRKNAPQNDIHISCNEFHPNWPRNVISTDINSFCAIKWSTTVNEPIFTKLVFGRQRSDFYTEFHENMANGSLWQRRTDVVSHKVSFSLRKVDLNCQDGFNQNLKACSFRTNTLLQLSIHHISTCCARWRSG